RACAYLQRAQHWSAGAARAGSEGMRDWRFWLAEQRGTLLAFGIFVVMFIIYTTNHPAGFTANVVQTASNKAVLLAFVAMAQTLVVITAGIDLSRSEEHTSELQSRENLVCRLLLEKKKQTARSNICNRHIKQRK